MKLYLRSSEYQLNLVLRYVDDFIDLHSPVYLNKQIELYTKSGYIETGHTLKTFPTFEQWKKLNNEL